MQCWCSAVGSCKCKGAASQCTSCYSALFDERLRAVLMQPCGCLIAELEGKISKQLMYIARCCQLHITL